MRVLWLIAAALAMRAEVIDRIAVIAGTEAITGSEVSQEIRLAAVMNETQADESPASRKAAAQRLVEQALVRREMTLGNYVGASDQEAAAMVDALEKARGKAVFAGEMKGAGVTRAQLQGYAQWQASLLKFIDLRFRPAVQVTAEDVRKEFAAESANKPNGAKFGDVQAEIESRLTGERADEEMMKWLKEARATNRVVYVDEALKP